MSCLLKPSIAGRATSVALGFRRTSGAAVVTAVAAPWINNPWR
jgi:hypothetical protein